jgi:hypothetical protein
MSRRKRVFVSQAQLPFFPKRVLNPDLSQELYLRQAREQRRGIFLREHRQELRAISPDLFQKGFLLFLLECSPRFFYTTDVSFEPVNRHPLLQPVGSLGSHFIKGGTQRFWQQFYPMVSMYCRETRAWSRSAGFLVF